MTGQPELLKKVFYRNRQIRIGADQRLSDALLEREASFYSTQYYPG